MTTKTAIVAAAAVAGMLAFVTARAQSPSTLAFEVASVKPNKSGQRGGSNTILPGGRYVARNVTVRRVIGQAYVPLLGIQILGGPAWINSDTFDIEATAGRDASGDDIRLMLRELLADRFKFRAHMETQERPVYALVVRDDGKLGAQLQPSTVDCSTERGGGSSLPRPGATPSTSPNCGFRVGTINRNGVVQLALLGKGVTFAQLANELSMVGRVVFDRTGLHGRFDVDLKWRPDTAPAHVADADAPSIFTALQEQLGLKLQSTTGQVDILVIDSVQQPTPD